MSSAKLLKKQQQAIVEAYVDALRQEYEVLEHKRNELRGAYDTQFKLAMDVSNQALQLTALKEALDRTEKLCDILDDRIKELNLTEEVGALNVTIMEVAGESKSPVIRFARDSLPAESSSAALSASAWRGSATCSIIASAPWTKWPPCCSCRCWAPCRFSATSRKSVRPVGWYRSARGRRRPKRFARCGRPCTSDWRSATSRLSSSRRRRPATASQRSPATSPSPWPRPTRRCC